MKIRFLFTDFKNGKLQVESFDPFDASGDNAFDQAIWFAKHRWFPSDVVPKVFLLTEIPTETPVDPGRCPCGEDH